MRELRVLVVGSSTSFMTAPIRGSRTNGTYPERLPEELARLGIAARSSLRSQWYGMIHEARPRAETYRDTMPDVVILNFGMAECQPNMLPTWLNRHFTTWDKSTKPLPRWYRKRIAPTLWKRARWWQRFAARAVKMRTHRLSPKRFQLEMRMLAKQLRNDLQALVLVLDIEPPNAKIEHFLPGLGQRVAHYNDLLRATVTEIADPDVRFVEVGALVREHGHAQVLPDGLHKSPEGHRMVAQLLAEEIAPWAKETLG